MGYFAKYDDLGNLKYIVKGNAGGVEITEDEYKRLLTEIQQKAELVGKLCSGEITLSDVPQDWQEEIQRRVDERIAQQGAADEQEISAEEALDIILGGEV